MDIFEEQIIIRKKQPIDFVAIFGSIILAVVVFWLLIFGPYVFVRTGLGGLVFALAAAAIFGIYKLIIHFNQEFEYCFTNGMMDVDKIINRSKRKHLLEVNARKIEAMAKTDTPEYQRLKQSTGVKKVFACVSMNCPDNYYIHYIAGDGKQVLLVFTPNDAIKDGFRRYNPQKVIL